ncbi:MAG TPA: 2-amino-4-hydroxy-6-hydroxymethyldihydropteridine diphosphokinase [Planctomycetaceae bacterium]
MPRCHISRCHISLGGNSGPVGETFLAALNRLRSTPGCSVVAVSRMFETTAVGEHAGGSFLNAVAELEAELDPIALLDLLQSIERDLGRVRSVHWGPRTIDLDLLYYGADVIDSPRLVVPHPAAWYRRFVLDPLVEIAPDLVHPIKRETMLALRDRLLMRPLPVAVAGGSAVLKSESLAALSDAFADIRCIDWDLPRADAMDAAFIFWLGQPDRPRNPPDLSFESLPLVPRIDASAAIERPVDLMRHVVQSALG